MTVKRFVLLRHEMPPSADRLSHWDLMLEHDGKLLTWELPSLIFDALPVDFETVGLRRLVDHRLHYLDFEGAISGGRGTVSREDSGAYTTADNQSCAETVIVKLVGRRLEGELELPTRYFLDSPSLSKETAPFCGRVLRFNWQ